MMEFVMVPIGSESSLVLPLELEELEELPEELLPELPEPKDPDPLELPDPLEEKELLCPAGTTLSITICPLFFRVSQK